jgi:predicted dehydrogenase
MKIKMGMIGGGTGSFIGPIHRIAALMDGKIEIVSGALSSDKNKSIESGNLIGLSPDRIYSDWREMISSEMALSDEKRPDFITIVTPNNLHFEPSKAALEAGFNVVCDKPLCSTSNEARELLEIIRHKKLILCNTYGYSGYPMVKKAKELVSNGSLGKIRKVAVEYFQGSLSFLKEKMGDKRAIWRTDPLTAGISCAIADIGTHAFQLAEYITGLKINELCADLTATLPGRILDDDGNILLRFENGAKGSLLASKIALGEENSLRIKVYGDKASLSWEQMSPNDLIVRWPDKPYQVYRTATSFSEIGETVLRHSRLAAGHPEGFIEGFANIYRNFAMTLEARKEGKNINKLYDFPDINDGLRGMLFIEAAVRSSSSKEKWISLE